MNYIIAAVICVTALLVSAFLIRENELLNSRQKRNFVMLSILVVFEITLDTLSLYMNGTSSDYNQFFKVVKACEFTVAPFIPTLLSFLICRKKCWNKIRGYYYIIIVINTSLQFITLFYPIMFRIEGNAVYSRTIFTYIYVLLLFIDMALLFFSSTKTFIQNFYRINSLAMITFLIIVGFIIRVICAKSNADWICISFSYFLFLEYFSNSFYKIDTLTTLLNQKAFINRINNINYSTVFIAIDVNGLKKINDTKGHLNGNRCLRKIGEAIYNVYHEVGFCYRSGGDEFTIILKPGELDKMKQKDDSNIYEQINELIQSLDKEIKHLSRKDVLLKYGVSQGFGIYNILSDCSDPDEYISVEAALNYADDRMYEAKKIFHELNN